MVLFFAMIAAAAVLDQVSKLLVLEYLRPITDFPLIKNVLHLTYLENRAAAFGILAEHRWVFMLLSSVAILAIVLYVCIRRPKNRLALLALGMIVGGGIGNMIDRIFRGFVVDFVNVELIHFAIFNLADSFVVVGVGLLILYLIRDELAQKKLREGASHDDSSH